MKLMSHSITLLMFVVLVVGGSVPGAFTTRAAEVPEVLMLRAESLAAEDRCEEALPTLARARAAAPGDARAAHLAGQCQLRLRRFEDAIASLEQAKRLDPELPDLDLHLAIARFHTRDLDGAEAALAEARRRTPDRAEAELYHGLLLLERGDDAGAAAALERARQRDRAAVEPIASYYTGLAWMGAADQARGRTALERVREEMPASSWAQAAERLLSGMGGVRGLHDRRDLEARHQSERPLGSLAGLHRELPWLVMSLGVEHDDNVVLRGSGVEIPQEISDEDDARMILTLQAGRELVRRGNWAAGAFGAYYGSAHQDVNEFNVQFPSVTLWADRILDDESTARLQYDFGYAWVDGDPYLAEHRITPALFKSWGRGVTRIYTEFVIDDFLYSNRDVPDGAEGGSAGDECPGDPLLCGPFGIDERDERDRDGWGLTAGIRHTAPIDVANAELFAGYRYRYYWAEGSEYDYQGHELRAGLRSLLPFDLSLDMQASYTYRPFRHSSTYPDPTGVALGVQYALSGERRRDQVYRFDAVLEREINERMLASFRYSYLGNDSNTDVFDYNRNIVGAYLTVRFGQ